jgi:hypothetical protein
MRLGTFYLSGNQLKTQKYQMKLSTLVMHPGETQLNNSIGIITKSGCNGNHVWVGQIGVTTIASALSLSLLHRTCVNTLKGQKI